MHSSWCWVPEGDETKKGPEKIFEEIIAENFLKMGKEIVKTKSRKHRVPGKKNTRRNTLRHIVIKLAKVKDKDKILKATREKQQITYKGTLKRL